MLSKEMHLSLQFYELPINFPNSWKIGVVEGKKYVKIINSPLISNP